MQSLRHVMPVLPVPVIAAVLLRAEQDSLSSLQIASQCDELIDEMIRRGAAMRPQEKPRQRTLANSLDLMLSRDMLLEEDDRYRVNPTRRPLVQYYANSIEHWWNAN